MISVVEVGNREITRKVHKYIVSYIRMTFFRSELHRSFVKKNDFNVPFKIRFVQITFTDNIRRNNIIRKWLFVYGNNRLIFVVFSAFVGIDYIHGSLVIELNGK